MRIPKFWAEGRVRHRIDKPLRRQITLRRWGWSDVSQEDAQAMADQRVQHALDDLLGQGWPNKGSVARREPKTSYNGAEGIPIREEILWTSGSDVATRNGYGAACLNTPDVMIADLDEDGLRRLPSMFGKTGRWVTGAVVLGAIAWTACSLDPPSTNSMAVCAAESTNWFGGFVLRLIALGGGTYAIAHFLRQAWFARMGGAVGWLRHQLANHPGRWALYQTPAGARAIRLDRTMDPTSDESDQLMASFHSDCLYRQMCRKQACYRARLTPKPWRMGYDRLRGSVWPVEGEKLVRREDWVAGYDRLRSGWGACHWVEDLGLGGQDSRCMMLRALHDEHALPEGNNPKRIA